MIRLTYFSNVWDAFKTSDFRRIARTLIKTSNIYREVRIEMQIKRKSELGVTSSCRVACHTRARCKQFIRVRHAWQIRCLVGKLCNPCEHCSTVFTTSMEFYRWQGNFQLQVYREAITCRLRILIRMFVSYVFITSQIYLSWDKNEKKSKCLKNYLNLLEIIVSIWCNRVAECCSCWE